MFQEVIMNWAHNNPFETYVVMVILMMAGCYIIEKWG